MPSSPVHSSSKDSSKASSSKDSSSKDSSSQVPSSPVPVWHLDRHNTRENTFYSKKTRSIDVCHGVWHLDRHKAADAHLDRRAPYWP